jgi:predicted permease
MNELFRRLRYLLNRRRFDRELADDMAFHREMAEREGRVNFGNPLRLREEARDAWGWTWIDALFQDFSYASRMLRKSPGFTLVAVLLLALGIGVNVAAFGFFNLMVLRPLPVRNPETILHFQRRAPGNFADNFPYAEVAFFRENCRSLSVLALSFDSLRMEMEDKPLHANFVTANFFSELGTGPALGRLLDPIRDEASDADLVVVLDHTFWERQFAADPTIIGRTIHLNGKPVTVVGVTESKFSGLGLDPPALWLPISQQPFFSNGNQVLTDFSGRGVQVQMWGRLKLSLTPRVADQELSSLAKELRAQHPNDIWKDESFPSEPGGRAVIVRREMYPLLAMVGILGLLILVVACSNLGGLLLARGITREREIAIRVAVGAGRGRLIRQLLTESLVLALLGLAAGMALGSIVLRLLIVKTELPAWLNAMPDWRVTAFAVAMGFVAAILFGLTPSLQVAKQRQRAAHQSTLLRKLMIGAQVAASCTLLIAAGLLVRALNQAINTDPGFDFRQIISIDPRFRGYTLDQARTYFNALRAHLQNLPGVQSTALVSNPPLGNRWTVIKTEIAGHDVDVHINHVDSAFFQTMHIPLLRGRNLARGDTHAVIVSESLARRQWPAEDPVGKPLRIGTDHYIVVGVSGSARLVSPEDSDAVELYQLADGDLSPMVVMVRTSVPPEEMLRRVAATTKTIDPLLFPDVQLMKDSFRAKLRFSEYAALAASVPGLIALLVACLGILGLVSFAVSERTREIGIRMALGAKPSHVLMFVLGQFSFPIAGGMLVGIGGGAACSQILRRMLYGISNLDPISYLAALGVFAAAVILAASLPAARALRIDPARALRHD